MLNMSTLSTNDQGKYIFITSLGEVHVHGLR